MDSAWVKRKTSCFTDIPNIKKSIQNYKSKNTKPVLFSRGKRTVSFFTEDSKKYLSPREKIWLERGLVVNRASNHMDSVAERIARNYLTYYPSRRGGLALSFLKRYEKFKNDFQSESVLRLWHMNPQKIWNASIIGALLLGMISMTLIYRYLGEGVLAKSKNVPLVVNVDQKQDSQILGANDAIDRDIKEEVQYIGRMFQEAENKKQEEFEKEILSLVKGYPIEKMVPYIAEKDKIVAAFLVAIAKKESNWGRRVPVLNGQDCHNFWGYRGKRARMGTGEHTCFDSPEDAVDTVAKRIQFLVSNKKLNTPEKMVIWKCGSDCEATGGREAALKWISDVNLYFQKLNY